MDHWLDYCRLNPKIFIDQTLELDLSLFRQEAYHKTYGAAGVKIDQGPDPTQASYSQGADVNEKTRVESDTPAKSLCNPTCLVNTDKKGSDAKGSQVSTENPKGTAGDGGISYAAILGNTVKAPAIANAGEQKPVKTLADYMEGYGIDGEMDMDDEGEGQGDENHGGEMEIESLRETDAEGETEESETGGSDSEAGDDGDDDGGEDDEGPYPEDSQTEDAADPFTSRFRPGEQDRGSAVEKRAQDFEEGYDHQEQKRRKVYKSPKKSPKRARGIVRGGPGMVANAVKCGDCQTRKGQICWKQDPKTLKRPALCCWPCRKRGRKCSLNVARGGTAQVGDTGDDGDRGTEDDEGVKATNTEQDGLEQEDVSSENEATDGEAAYDEVRELVKEGKPRQTTKAKRETRADGEGHEPQGGGGAGSGKRKQGPKRAKLGSYDQDGDTNTQNSDMDEGVEHGNPAVGASKKEKAPTGRLVQPASAASTRAAPHPRVNPSDGSESTQALNVLSAATHRAKQPTSKKVPVDEGLDGSGTERWNSEGTNKNTRARSTVCQYRF